MNPMEQHVHRFAKPASIGKYENKVAKVITRDEIVALNATIKPKLDQNRRERQASWLDAKDKTVK